MDLVKQYLVQCIITAANSLRLSSEKIEVVAMLRDNIARADDIEEHIRSMKKITELSKFAIRLGEVHNYIGKAKIDFLKLSDDFKEHSHSLIRELSNLLDVLTPQNFKLILDKVKNKDIQVVLTEDGTKSGKFDKIITGIKNESVDNCIGTIRKDVDSDNFNSMADKLELNDSEENDEFTYENFEDRIVTPIKEIESLLKKLALNDYDAYDLAKFIDIFEDNFSLSEKAGFEIIADMHNIFLNALQLIADRKIIPDKDLIERMRSCLIVIVAVVRGKDVDISNYLKKAENFSLELKKYSVED